ncbi:MAG TPA: phosphotransferase family protein [Allosphingosinicella sp.]|jgi:aminoglycoside phosphotransferase (APT) family kinase protein
MSTGRARAASATTSRFVEEDLRSLAAYVQAAVAALDQPPGDVPQGTSAAHRHAEALEVLRRVAWHLAAPPSPSLAGAALIAADQKAFSAPPRQSTFLQVRSRFEAATLEALLRETLAGGAQIRIEEVKQLVGGRSKLTAIVAQSGCATLPGEIVLRQDWASAVTGTSVATEHALLQRISANGIRTPKPFHFEPSPEPLGGAFMLMERAAGATCGDLFQPPVDPRLALDLAEELGRLHRLSADTFANLPGMELRDHGPEQLAPRLARLAATTEALGQSSAVIRQAIEQLRQTIPAIGGPVALIHADLGFHNILVENGRVSALLDWEFAHLGHPAEDLGYIRGDIEQMVPWDAFIATYRAAGGPAVTEEAVNFYQLWGMIRLYAMLVQGRAALRAGLVQDVGVARMCADWIPRLIERLSGALDRPEA